MEAYMLGEDPTSDPEALARLRRAEPLVVELTVSDVVEVVWNDAWADHGIYEEDTFDPVWPRFCWGTVVRIDEGFVTLATDYSVRTNDFSGVNVIPVPLITGVRILGRMEAPA
jgi:hypothetical protein